MNPQEYTSAKFRNSTFIFIAGIAGSLFFFIGVVISLMKLISKKPGLIISEEGIVDNTTVFGFGMIEWSDISSIKAYKINSKTFIALKLYKPEKYISRITNPILKKLAKANTKMSGTPINLNPSAIKISSKKLEQLLLEELKKRKSEEKM